MSMYVSICICISVSELMNVCVCVRVCVCVCVCVFVEETHSQSYLNIHLFRMRDWNNTLRQSHCISSEGYAGLLPERMLCWLAPEKIHSFPIYVNKAKYNAMLAALKLCSS